MRYADPNFPSHDWQEGENYVLQNRWNQSNPDLLSPAEKYDWITGVSPSEPGALTRHQWSMGRGEYERTGSVAGWQGICHGWAPASIYLPEPKRDVRLYVGQGSLLFTVDDIKALGSLYWANGQYQSLYAGRRCNENDPEANEEGRVLGSECFDVNPAEWHLAAVNLLGARQESFVIDAAETSEVWNHPVVSYQMEFFDANNIERRAQSFLQVLRPINTVTRHRQFRSRQAAYVVGVVSRVMINVEVMPGGGSHNQNNEMTFVYDLELDANLNVIGGEWRDASRPDFLWRPRPGYAPTTAADSVPLMMQRLGDANWRQASLMSSRNGAPARMLVEELFRRSAE